MYHLPENKTIKMEMESIKIQEVLKLISKKVKLEISMLALIKLLSSMNLEPLITYLTRKIKLKILFLTNS